MCSAEVIGNSTSAIKIIMSDRGLRDGQSLPMLHGVGMLWFSCNGDGCQALGLKFRSVSFSSQDVKEGMRAVQSP